MLQDLLMTVAAGAAWRGGGGGVRGDGGAAVQHRQHAARARSLDQVLDSALCCTHCTLCTLCSLHSMHFACCRFGREIEEGDRVAITQTWTDDDIVIQLK